MKGSAVISAALALAAASCTDMPTDPVTPPQPCRPDGVPLAALAIGPIEAPLGSVRAAVERTAHGDPALTFELAPAEAEALAALTSAKEGVQIPVRLDGRVIAEPYVMTPILGGSFQINGVAPEEDLAAIVLRLAPACEAEDEAEPE